MAEIYIAVEIPYDDMVNATVALATGDGNINPSGDGKRMDISITDPMIDELYTQNIMIDVELIEGAENISFKPWVRGHGIQPLMNISGTGTNG